ncbi:integrator complex subunit 5 [Episyrphus balteatus]|uniref:integrator complex subunit 5 n=1 Tax=Episyrphus balteatus TaxID=286459 RepID=UPI00248617C9|nr:integrator complex subunit 5 [Episyrphus balteatus]
MLKQHILIELKQFITAITSHRGNPKNINATHLVRTSLHLLEDLPASREIVFEYFSLVFDVAVANYVANAGNDSKAQQQLPQEDESFTDIQEALENLVNKGPPAWSPVIASWSLDLVGKLSDKYSHKRKMSIGASCNFWLNCNAMKGLLSLISSCFRKLTDSEAESCVETLLAAFQRYSLTFDWVVARLGGCFPLKIISQILQCGLKRFSEDNRCRFDSEIGILDYLSFAHENELLQALRGLLEDGFVPKKAIHVHIIPFITQISHYSESLLQNVVKVFLELYNDTLLEAIIRQTPVWMTNKTFMDMQPSFNSLPLNLEKNGSKLLMTAARLAEQYSWCQEFLEYNLQELEQVILMNSRCPLLSDLSTDASKFLLWKGCLSWNTIEQQTAVRLLLLVSTQQSHIYHQTISELLRKSYTVNKAGISALIRIIGTQNGVVDFPAIKPGIQMALEEVLLKLQFHEGEQQTQALNTFQNLATLAKLEKKGIVPYLKLQSIMNTLNDCLAKVMELLNCALSKLLMKMEDSARSALSNNNNNNLPSNDSLNRKRTKSGQSEFEKMDTSEVVIPKQSDHATLVHTIVDLLNTIESGSRMNVMSTTDVLKLSSLTVKYFFWSLTEKSPTIRSTAVNRAFDLFQRQCSARKSARSVCLRELVEGALFFYGYLFGAYEDPEVDEPDMPENEMLIYANQKQSVGPNANRTVLHAGVIGKGLRSESNQAKTFEPDPEIQRLLLKAIDCCCSDWEKPNHVDGYSMVSLLLVEMVSTDVMYNGLPFPDEEFTKVTMERDLRIRRTFMSSPILWALLGLIATHRPALCFSSVLLRALCATCLHQWRAKNVNKFQQIDKNDELMQCTIKLLQILSMGQLLPPPLASLHMIIEYFDAPEIALVLKECIWNYLKDNVPSPALFTCDNNALHWRNPSTSKIPPQYVDILRNIMQKKLSKLGTHYHQMFQMGEMDSSPMEVVEK